VNLQVDQRWGEQSQPDKLAGSVDPDAVARSLSGNHVVTTRLLMGYDGTSGAPIASRRANSIAAPEAKPSNLVASDHNAISTAYSLRGCIRSTSHPPGTWQNT